jgi:hypothetical protein
MHAWNGFRKFAAILTLATLPAPALADGFDSFVIPEGAEQFGDSVLVDGPTTPEPATGSPVIVREQIPHFGSRRQGNSGSASGAVNRILEDVDPRWIAEVDLLMLWQNNLQSRPLFINDANGRVALDANQAQTPMALGPRVGLAFNIDPVHAIEGNYFQAGFFEGDAFTAPGQYSEANLAGNSFSPIDAAGYGSSGFIQSAEMNWRRRQNQPISWIAGFRWVEWNQDMAIVEVAEGEPSAAYVGRAGNDLYGGQLGMDVCLWNEPQGWVKVNTVGKAGVFFNNAYQRLGFVDPNGVIETAAQAGETSFFGEITATMTVALTKHLSWRAGYSLFWLSGVAVPAGQLSKTKLDPDNPPATAAIDANGSVLLNGATTGLELRW